MTVDDAFSIFKSELELPDRKAAQAAAAQQDLRERIGRHLDIPDSFLCGSYARHTKIDPLSDIDMFLVRNKTRTGLSTDGSGVSPQTALDQVATAVRSAYGGDAQIKMQHRSVNVQVKGVPFGFDLVPAWLRAPDGFWIPDTKKSGWIPSDPQWHAEYMKTANEASGGRLKPLVKMTKHWSQQNDDLLCSFHIELMCREILASENVTSWPFGMAAILVGMLTRAGQPMHDPTYGQTRVDKELTPDEYTKLMNAIKFDSSNAINALRLQNQGNHEAAINEWRQIFLNGFPRF